MNTENIDEAEILIKKYRIVMSAKEDLKYIFGEDGGDPESFTLVDEDTKISIYLPGLKDECIDAIERVLNDKRDKIISRLKEI